MNTCAVIILLTLMSKTFALNLDYLNPKKLQTRTPSSVQEAAALKIIKKYSDQVIVEVNTDLFRDEKDAFSLRTVDGKLHIRASTGLAAVWGFNYYLKKYCKSHIGWQVKRVKIPTRLPAVDENVVSSDRFRYYQNVCTFSYSFVWWDVTQWSEHVEWMALNGINLALAPIDQEAAWAKVYKQVGMAEDEINKHFTGPAFLSWLRMGNIHGWAGPLYKSWHDRQSKIQAAVVNQMYNLGIVPVLPAFSGHVPSAFSKIYPHTIFQRVSGWNGFGSNYCCGLFIHPSDPLFKTIGQMFLREISHQVTLSHIYSTDLFNEVELGNMTADIIESAARATFASISEVDKDAVWLVQNWMFVNKPEVWSNENAKAFLLAVPNGRMLVLDLEAEHIPQYEHFPMYYGQPFIWCMLHNFGGTLGMVGKITSMNKSVYEARSKQNSTMIGIGLTPEGINTDYVMYDFMLETAWRQSPVSNLVSWVEDYAERRYGCKETAPAWRSLLNGIYDYTSKSDVIYGHNKYVLTHKPFLNSGLQPTAWYTSKSIFKALKFLAFAPRNCNSAGFRHDLVDVTRQSLLYRAEQIQNYLLRNISLNATDFKASINLYLDVLHDMEQILASNDDFTAKSWLTGARNVGTNAKERDSYEFNARNQITLWGPNGEISDYATKQWAEIFHYYYIPRWSMFLKAALDARIKHVKFNEQAAQRIVKDKVEKPFAHVKINWLPKIDTIKLSRMLYKKWKSTDLPDLPETP